MAVPTLYSYAGCPFCRSVLMLVKYAGIKLNVKEVDIRKLEHKTPEFAEMNPQQSVPTLDDNGFYLWESRAVLTYLPNKYAPDSPLYPKDPKERANVDRMLYFDVGTLCKAALGYLYPQWVIGQPADPEKEKAFKEALVLLEQFLSKTTYVAGNHITVADFSILAVLTLAEIVDYSYADFPKVSAWIQKMKSVVPNYKDINDEPIKKLKEAIKSEK